jgi:DNA (cytosine-5)-methyltransferase 1
MEKNKFTHGSLFSGIDGSEIAAEIMGWKNMFHCEINPFGRKILDYWFPNSKSYEDITKTDFREWQGKINVLTGGFPCQPFSCAGQRKGAEDDRYLWPEMLRAIREIQPDWVVGENVAGILTMVQPGSETALGREESLFGEVDRERTLHRQEYVVETVCNDLEREGYSVQPVVIPACAVGAPHRRDRVWFIAKRAATDSTDAGTETVQRERKDGVLSDKYVTHTDGKKLQKRLETGRRTDEAENRARMDNGIERFGSLRNAPYSSSEGLSTLRFPTSIEKKKRENEDGCSVQPAGNVRRTPFAERWENFPTQSPVCSRDDGIFTGLDGIAFSKWRQESIKAYGNAIVPQVMYEIFLAIESIEKGK